jgi:cytochrome c oxidase cbb3-type subunit 3
VQGGGFAALALALLLPLLLIACDREQRDMAGQPKAETPAFVARGDPRAAEYENNAFHIAQGQRLFAWFNCSGCHSHGGGGMGPPLMDAKWRYGGKMEDIVASILYGRPNGMPDWRNKITEQQAWELAAYVRSLSGQSRKDAVSARSEEMAVTPPQSLESKERNLVAETPQSPPGEPQ